MRTHIPKTSVFECKHLPKSRQIQTGSFYTPEKIVDKVHHLIAPYKTKAHAVILDSSAGAGAFIRPKDNIPYKAVEWDPKAGALLSINCPGIPLFMENALQNSNREKYHISCNDFLIQIGNPPYNDTTSAYRNGKKGQNLADPDLFDRDIGISFLKSYNKLQSDVVCVLHPLSYLIKQTNFRRLGAFRQNYRLKKGILFSSQLFKSVSKTAFPVLIGLYTRDLQGMSYDYIKNFKFFFLEKNRIQQNNFSRNHSENLSNNALKSQKEAQGPQAFFKFNQYPNVDSFIRKYPPFKSAVKVSDINLYYWTFRDINSLLRNKGFHTQKTVHSIVVSLNNCYQYAYLSAFKKLFQPQNLWLYGNLSPLGDEKTVKKHKKLFVEYMILSEQKLFSQLSLSIKNRICRFYQLNQDPKKSGQSIEKKVAQIINKTWLIPAKKPPLSNKSSQMVFFV